MSVKVSSQLDKRYFA